jgi:SAM-dependent methyltransferase
MAGDIGLSGVAVLTVVLTAVVLVAVYTVRLGAPPWPSSPAARRVLLAALPDRVEGEILDLGCGWGGIALALAARYPDRRVTGVELSPVPWAVARMRARAGRLGNLAVRRTDLHRVDVSRAGLIVCYLHRDAMTRLAARLRAEAPPGCLVVSNTFGLGDWTPLRRAPVGDAFGSEILIYRVPMGDAVPA